MRKLFPYIRPQLKPYVFLMLLKAGGTFTDLLIPLIMGVLIDTGIATGDTAMITRLWSRWSVKKRRKPPIAKSNV